MNIGTPTIRGEQGERLRALDVLPGDHGPVRLPHLVTDGAVVVGVHHGHLDDGVADEEAVARRDVDGVEVVFLPVQRPLHVQFPFTLNQAQSKRPAEVPT